METLRNSQDMKLIDRYFEVAKKVSSNYATIPNVTGIVVGGSLARGFVDEHADIEMYVYYDGNLPSMQAIKNILDKLDAKMTRSLDLHWFHPAWGYHTFFQANGVKFELGYRDIHQIISRMERFLFGDLMLPQHGIHDVPFGHYESGVANCIAECVILFDPNGKVHQLKDLVRVYPKRLKQNTAEYYLEDARTITEAKIHYAVLRDDTYHFNACAARVVRAIVLCLFALNETYFPGDKWNKYYISNFKIKPQNCESLMNDFFSTSDLSRSGKEKKTKILSELISWIEFQCKQTEF